MKNENSKLNKKLKDFFSIPKKFIPGLILFSFVLSGLLAPVSFSENLSVRSLTLKVTRGETIAETQARRTEEQKKTAAAVIPGEAAVRYVPGAPPTTSALQTITAGAGAPAPTDPFTCSVSGFKGCIVGFFHLIFQAAAYVLELAGWLFDITVAFTLSKNILDSSFAKDGWVVTRDLANMFFIFILLYIAIATILEIAAYNAKALLARLIIVALLLNFSLFFTRVIIDASNILGLAFYNGISASETYQKKGGEKFEASSFVSGLSVTPKGISVGLISSFDPQKLFGVTNENATEIAKFVKDNYGKLIFVFLFGTAILLSAAWAFFAVALLFVTRVVTLWFLMATAPIAFAAIILPKTRSLFGKWMDELISKSFCVAVFLFFLWLITKFADQGFLKGLVKKSGGIVGGDPNGYLITLTLILLNFLIIFILIVVAKQQTQKMCGAVAGFSMNFVNGLGTKAAGFLAGGVGGFALRNTLGAYAYKKAEDWNKAGYGGGGLGARLALQAARKVAGASFNVKATKLGKTAGFGEAGGKGGYSGWVKERTAKDVAFARSFGVGEKADEAREAFAGKLGDMGWFGRTITGRGMLSKIQPEKAVKEVEKMTALGRRIREAEENIMSEAADAAMREEPVVYDTKNGKKNYRSMAVVDWDIKQGILEEGDRAKIVNIAAKTIEKYAKTWDNDLISKNAELASLRNIKRPTATDKDKMVTLTKQIGMLNRNISAVKEHRRLEDKKAREGRTEATQTPGGGSASGGGGTKTP